MRATVNSPGLESQLAALKTGPDIYLAEIRDESCNLAEPQFPCLQDKDLSTRTWGWYEDGMAMCV